MKNMIRKGIFLKIGFTSEADDTSLELIEIIGIPGEESPDGSKIIDQEIQEFFDSSIVKPLFNMCKKSKGFDFKIMKIWLYNSNIRNEKNDYDLPTLDNNDIKIVSSISGSNLIAIYVLDNNLKGNEYIKWKEKSEKLLSSLFSRFIAPPKISQEKVWIFASFAKVIETSLSTLDKHANLKRNLFFDSLIVQID